MADILDLKADLAWEAAEECWKEIDNWKYPIGTIVEGCFIYHNTVSRAVTTSLAYRDVRGFPVVDVEGHKAVMLGWLKAVHKICVSE